MKHTMLLVSKSPTTNTGLRSYLNNIFSSYIDLEARLADDVDTALMEKFDLVLFASREATKHLESQMTPKIHFLTCIRTFNHTYLNRILVIPPNSDVYLVNDSLETASAVINLLYTFGITQYHFIPYYPGTQEIDYSIQYAVTVGESRFVPRNIPTAIDIGVRIADISTITEIASFFNLPLSLADEVTKNYINQFVQLLKISNHQLSQATNTKFITQSIISNIDTGVCILDSSGNVTMVNKTFIEALSIQKPHLVGSKLVDAVPELIGKINSPLDKYSPFVTVTREDQESLTLSLQEIEDTNHEKLILLHCCGGSGGTPFVPDSENQREEDPQKPHGTKNAAYYHFSDYLTCNDIALRNLETAKRISLTSYRLLIQGESGTGKGVLAQAIHNNSNGSLYPFVRMNLKAMATEQVIHELAPASAGGGGILERAENGTLYLDGVDSLNPDLQREFIGMLDMEPNVRIIASSDDDLFALCQAGVFSQELFYRINEVSVTTIPIRKRPEDIPILFEYFLQNIYNNPGLHWNELCSDALCHRLTTYQWPGNVKEIENLCKYFYCVRTNNKLTSKDLPPYILAQMAQKQEKLAPLERQILYMISQTPKIGRTKLYQLLQDQGMEVTEGKIRSMLQSLSERQLIKMNRTKGGCEITEEGEILL